LAAVGPDEFDAEILEDVLGGIALGDAKELVVPDVESIAPALAFFSGVLEENMHATSCPYRQSRFIRTRMAGLGTTEWRVHR
jgi:hypothetical protein